MLSTKALRLKSKREAKKMMESSYSKTESSSSKKKFKARETLSVCDDVAGEFCEASSSKKISEVIYINEIPSGNDIPVECMEVNWPNNESVKEKIRLWAVKHGLTTTVVNELLEILRESDIKVPKDIRTLKGTPKDVVATPMGDGKYVHYGLKDALTDFCVKFNYQEDIISLDFNIDGLPLSKSSNLQVWPILGSVSNNSEVFLTGVYEGRSKPKCANEFLEEFVSELNELVGDGFAFNSKLYSVKVRCFVMDTPARAYILGTKGHSGYFSCTRCEQKGEHVKNRLVFPFDMNCTSRTNERFRNRAQPEHHNAMTPIAMENIQIDMVHQFTLDYMHVVCLGVMRTLLKAWVKVRGENYSLTSSHINKMSESLNILGSSIPYEFCRKPRSLKELDRWKATELRQFLLYTGPFVLKNILTAERYHHFLKLSVAIRILLDEEDCKKNILFARNLLANFVKDVPVLYDVSYLTCNFHNLLHLHEDAKEFGSLESISAFKFENHLQKLKKHVKKFNNVAAQFYKRQVEISNAIKPRSLKADSSFLLGKFAKNSYSNIKTKFFFLSLLEPNNFCLVNDSITKITKINTINNSPQFEGTTITNLKPLFENPVSSQHLFIFLTNKIEEGNKIVFDLNKIKKKIVCLHDTINKQIVLLPEIHHGERVQHDLW